ncbi:MAG TPA: hypothetical protein VF881_02440 [Polyangiaceae bacterium]
MQVADFTGAYEAGRSHWPGVKLDSENFARRAIELEIPQEDLAARAADLYLAWACAERDPAALGFFERTFLTQVDQYVGRLGLSDHVVDEVRQELRIRLLLGEEPRIGRYGGRGPLGAWIRVAAIRLALGLTGRVKGGRAKEVEALDALVIDRSSASPELVTIRDRYRGAFQEALERSLASLEARERTLLRMHFIDRLNIEAIGEIYRVHRATVARWLVGIRQRVLANLRQELSLNLHATSSEFRSMLAVVRDELDLSLRHLGQGSRPSTSTSTSGSGSGSTSGAR